MNTFVLHPRLEADTAFVADWTLSRVLLTNDTRYLWLTLVPRRAGAVEIFDLAATDRAVLIEEIARASEAAKTLAKAEKINVGALGNIVPQLHVHIVARSTGDFAWPGPVWGQGSPVPYTDDARAARLQRLREVF